MNEKQASVSSVGFRYGLFTGLVSIVYSLILFLADLNLNRGLGAISYVILIIGIVLAYREFKKENLGYMSYGQGLGIGTLLGIITGVMSGIFIYVYVSFVDPTFLEKVREAQIIELERQNYSDEQIEQALAMAERFTGPAMMAIFAVVGSIILAFLFSLVIAAIMRNSRPDFE